jgi:hypothetical protein
MWLLIAFLVLIPGLHDDDFLPLGYGGMWSVVEDDFAHGGTYMQTTSGTLTFSFHGSGFALYGTQSDTGGTAEICIDEDCYITSWSAVTTLYQVAIISVSNLSDDTHTITITAQDDGLVTVDAVYIAPSIPAPQPTAEPAPDWITVNADGTGVVENRITSGEQGIFLMLVALVVIQLVSVTAILMKG